MSKAVLMSIQPKWCELIANGKKTVEVRKTRPKIDVPFKCYIYESKGKKKFFSQPSPIPYYEGKRSKATGAKLKREGLREGVSDICLPVKRGQYGSLYIELKRRKGSRVSDKQSDWIDLMWELGNAAYICYGWEEAAKCIEEYLNLTD